MGFEKEQGTCTGRGFADTHANGYLKNLKDFVNNHSDWDIIRDRSAFPSQVTCTDANGTTEIITAPNHGYKNGDEVRFQDIGNGLPSGINTGKDYLIGVESVDTFRIYSFRKQLQSKTYVTFGSLSNDFGVTLSLIYILVSNDGVPIDGNDLKNMVFIGYNIYHWSGYIFCKLVGAYNSTNEEILFVWSSSLLNVLDDGGFTYDFRANDNGLFYIQSEIASTWRGCGVDEFTPLANYLEFPDIVSGTAQTSLSNGNDVVVQVTNADEANLFTNGEWYYIYDMRYDPTVPRISVAYGECNGVGVDDGLNADEIRFATLNNDFNSGAKISPYPLLLYSMQPNADSTHRPQIPFYGRSDGTTGHYCIYDQGGVVKGGYIYSRGTTAMNVSSPDDKGNYTVKRPLIMEFFRPNSDDVTTQMNRSYGESKNIYISNDDGMTVMQTDRIIGSKSHIDIADEEDFRYSGHVTLCVLMINEA